MKNIDKEISELENFIKETEKEQIKYSGWTTGNYSNYLSGQINIAHNRLERLQDKKWLNQFSEMWKANHHSENATEIVKSSDIERLIKLATHE